MSEFRDADHFISWQLFFFFIGDGWGVLKDDISIFERKEERSEIGKSFMQCFYHTRPYIWICYIFPTLSTNNIRAIASFLFALQRTLT